MMNVQVTILQSPRNVQNKDQSLFPFLVHRLPLKYRTVVEQQELKSGLDFRFEVFGRLAKGQTGRAGGPVK